MNSGERTENHVHSGQGWEAMAFKHGRRSPGFGTGQGGKSSVRCDHSRRQKGVDLQVLFRNECVDAVALQTVWGQRPSGLQGKHKQAMYAESKEWYSGSSSSSGGEEWKSQEQEEIKWLRVQVELLSKQQGTGKSPKEPGEPSRRGSGLEEGCSREFDEGTYCKEKPAAAAEGH